jgi:hypothetical protein
MTDTNILKNTIKGLGIGELQDLSSQQCMS